MNEQRRLIPVRVTYLNDSWLMMPADDKNSTVTIKGSEESFIKVLKGIKAFDNQTRPVTQRQLTYGQMVSDIKMNSDTTIFVWSTVWEEFSKTRYYILD